MTSYLLLLADLLLVALLLTVAGYLLVGLLRLPFARNRPPAAASASRTSWRRCENCKHRWEGRPGDDRSAVSLRLRRAVRRRARKRQRDVAWARARGWSRCPSCLSRQVRDSRRQTVR